MKTTTISKFDFVRLTKQAYINQVDHFSLTKGCALQDLEVAMSLPEVTTRDRELRRSLQFTLRLEAILHHTTQMVS